MEELSFNYTTDENAGFKKFKELKTGDPVFLAIYNNHKREYTIKKLFPQVMINQEKYEHTVALYPHMACTTEVEWENMHWWDNWVFLFFPEFERLHNDPNAKPPYWDAIVNVQEDDTWSDETWDITDSVNSYPHRCCNICTTLEEAEIIIRGEMEVARKNAEERIRKAQADLVEIAVQETKLAETIKLL